MINEASSLSCRPLDSQTGPIQKKSKKSCDLIQVVTDEMARWDNPLPVMYFLGGAGVTLVSQQLSFSTICLVSLSALTLKLLLNKVHQPNELPDQIPKSTYTKVSNEQEAEAIVNFISQLYNIAL